MQKSYKYFAYHTYFSAVNDCSKRRKMLQLLPQPGFTYCTDGNRCLDRCYTMFSTVLKLWLSVLGSKFNRYARPLKGRLSQTCTKWAKSCISSGNPSLACRKTCTMFDKTEKAQPLGDLQ